jgi:hypothetical protein
MEKAPAYLWPINGISSRKKSGFVREYQLLLSKHSLASLFFSVLGGFFFFLADCWNHFFLEELFGTN